MIGELLNQDCPAIVSVLSHQQKAGSPPTCENQGSKWTALPLTLNWEIAPYHALYSHFTLRTVPRSTSMPGLKSALIVSPPGLEIMIHRETKLSAQSLRVDWAPGNCLMGCLTQDLIKALKIKRCRTTDC